MANTIKIKRATSNRRPGSLSEGELAYSETSRTVWIGDSGPSVKAVSGDGVRVRPYARLKTQSNLGTYSATGGATSRGQLTGMPSTHDSLSLAAGDIILVAAQTNQAANGVYRVSTLGSGANGVWDRIEWLDEQDDAVNGVHCWVQEGTNAGQLWMLTNAQGYTLGGGSGSNLTWEQKTGGGAFTAGTGISITGSTIAISGSYTGQASITTVGTIGTGTWQGTPVAAPYGGTGLSSYTAGNYINAANSTTLQQRTPSQVLSDIGGAAASHNHSAADITSGTLPVARGGTGAGTLTGLVKGNGTSAFTAAVAGTDYLDPNSTIDGGTF